MDINWLKILSDTAPLTLLTGFVVWKINGTLDKLKESLQKNTYAILILAAKMDSEDEIGNELLKKVRSKE